MKNYSFQNKWQKLITPNIVSLLTKIHEFKGEQSSLVQAKADILNQLIEIAKMQSIQASNKIEGISTTDDRLKKIIANKATPKTKNEQELAGYRDVLATIYQNHNFIPIKPSMLLQLHQDLYKFSGKSTGGIYKNADNLVAEDDSQGNMFTCFHPVPAWETAHAMESLCNAFDEIQKDSDVDPLLIIPMFVLDFLCIHPFNDGNGRMSRLLTLLLLYRAGYIVGKYISIEKLIEQTKDTYYEALQRSSIGWHENENDYIPFVEYTLGVIVAAYREFSARVKDFAINNLSKSERIRKIIQDTIGSITKTEIMNKCPDISQITVQRALNELVTNGDIIKIGGGRYTKYVWNHEKEN